MTPRANLRVQHRISALDGLRGVAVLLVIAGHLAPTYINDGGVGVDIFFALSGYLITSILLREFEARGTISFRHFYLRRLARLTPALVLVLLAAGAAVSLVPGHVFKWSEIGFAATYTMNWARAFGSDSAMLGHTWSLGIEEQFYLVWPPILLATLFWRPRDAPFVALILALISALWSVTLFMLGTPSPRIYNGFDTRAVELLAGCALAFLPLESRTASFFAMLWPIPVVAITTQFMMPHSPLIPLGCYGLLGLAGAWIILALQKRCWLVTPLENPALVHLGRISYGLYLWHYLILSIFNAYGIHGLLRDLAVLFLTFVAAMTSYRWVETPILEMTNWQKHFDPPLVRMKPSK